MTHVLVETPSFPPGWAVLLPDAAPPRVMTLLDRYFERLSLAAEGRGERLEVWRGTGRYTAMFGSEPERGRGAVLAKELSRSIAGECYLVADDDVLDDIALVFEGGRQRSSMGIESARALAAKLGCPFPEHEPAVLEPRRAAIASVVIVPGSLASPPAIERAVIREETRRGEVVTLVRRDAFSTNHLLAISRAAGERTIHCVDWRVHPDTGKTFFQCSAFRAGDPAGTMTFPPRHAGFPRVPPARLVGAESADEVLALLGLTWADLGAMGAPSRDA